MARKKSDNKKWKTRPSRKKSSNRNKKPSKIRKNNCKRSGTKNRLKNVKEDLNSVITNDRLIEEYLLTEEIFDTRIVHDFLTERYLSEVRQVWLACQCCNCEHPSHNMQPAKEDHQNYHDCIAGEMICSFCYHYKPKDEYTICPHARFKNLLEITSVPLCLKLGFLEQRAIALMHCYMRVLIIRGHQSAMKGQVVHCQADVVDNIGDLLPFPKCYEFMAVIQQKPSDHNGEIKVTVRYSVSAIQILRAIQYLIKHHVGYINKQVLSLEKIQEMFECRKEEIALIRIIDSYAYNNATTSAPIILDSDEALLGPSRTLKAGEDLIWQLQSGMEESTFPWIYPTGEGGELDRKRPISLKIRDYCKLRLMSADKRWQADPIWTFRAMNLIQRDDLCSAVNYHAKKYYKKDRLCYNIYPSIGKAVRGTSAYWSTPKKILRAMYATLSKPNIFLSINLQDDIEFLTHIDESRFGNVNNPNYHEIDNLSDDDYLQLVNENSALIARMCHRRMLAFEKFITDKRHPFFIDYAVANYFFKIEFQRGGLPHLHTLLWLNNFPNVDTLDGRKTIIEFIDNFLTTSLPDKQTDLETHMLVKKHQWHIHTFTCSKGNAKIRIRRGRKFKDEQSSTLANEIQNKDINKNYLHENEIYEQVDPNNDPDITHLAEAKSVLLKTGNAILSHHRVGKVEASWTVLGIPLYHSSIRCKILYISLPWEEERILKRGRTQVITTDDLVETLTHKYIKRPSIPSVIDNMTLFEFLTWFDYDGSSLNKEKILNEPVVENPLWRHDFEQPPLLQTTNLLPRIILSSGSILIQHKKPACISFHCHTDDPIRAIYSMLSIGIQYRDPIEQFLGGKQDNDIKTIRVTLLKYKSRLLERFNILPAAYKIQMINALEHLCDLNAHDFVTKSRESFIFLDEEEENTEDGTKDTLHQNNSKKSAVSTTNKEKSLTNDVTKNERENFLNSNKLLTNNTYTPTEQLLASANSEQIF
ncbi:unnamed protein product [Rotaria socialis]|uniref:Helitron helicase-like domain-containing protein n=1 Tax=Rotaria socialis TaxID=392032 RepID=A0A821RVB4_9BILA|nr:unnamed protein product [Rotaria socialis]